MHPKRDAVVAVDFMVAMEGTGLIIEAARRSPLDDRGDEGLAKLVGQGLGATGVP